MGSVVLFLLSLIPWLHHFIEDIYSKLIYLILLLTVWFLRDYKPARLFSLALLPFAAVYVADRLVRFAVPSFYASFEDFFDTAGTFTGLWLIGFGIYASIQTNKERKLRAKEEEQIRQAEARKAELEHLVVERTSELTLQKEELEKTLIELKAAQAQLVHSEKMASLGELTAGIAHEIQNPLNFVNNFSELSVELAQELAAEIEKPDPDIELIKDLSSDLTQNQEKINHHGKRAANIVTAMLQHARTNTGKKEPTDLNALADEYLRLAYHGLRAKDKSFNAKMVTDFDPAIDKMDVVAQDIGRVLLNLINNAFYAVTQKKSQNPAGYEPAVTVSSSRLLKPSGIEIRIKDNGTGIPDSVKEKIFQPFFTTKPTGQGTGLGLSLAYDIVTKGHGGTMKLESREGEGTEFIIRLPR
ncbi:MAG: histidine kinase [Lewinellaceae bacterium]|nr:histidine kinase [Lewinellaceae bacterium]